jgi:hypothetical protein
MALLSIYVSVHGKLEKPRFISAVFRNYAAKDAIKRSLEVSLLTARNKAVVYSRSIEMRLIAVEMEHSIMLGLPWFAWQNL